MRVLLATMDSYELTQWQAFFVWRRERQKVARKEAEFLKDDDEVIHY